MQGYLRQSVQLTGFDLQEFQKSIDNLQHLQQILARQVPDGVMEPFTPSSFSTYPSVDFGTRYFTSRRDDPHGTAIEFDRAIDPNGILASMATDGYFHGPDNEVLYYQLASVGHAQRPRCVYNTSDVVA